MLTIWILAGALAAYIYYKDFKNAEERLCLWAILSLFLSGIIGLVIAFSMMPLSTNGWKHIFPQTLIDLYTAIEDRLNK